MKSPAKTKRKAASTYPQFSYGVQLDAANNVFPMVPQNSAPALLVWLTLVTSVDFLNALDRAQGTNPDLVNADDFSKATNLSSDTVNKIFDRYRNATPALKMAHLAIADSFNAFARDSGYDRSNCPNGQAENGVQSTLGKDVLMTLATTGAAVNPNPPQE
jgi:hypothetical protein